jgi:hypothetical protein
MKIEVPSTSSTSSTFWGQPLCGCPWSLPIRKDVPRAQGNTAYFTSTGSTGSTGGAVNRRTSHASTSLGQVLEVLAALGPKARQSGDTRPVAASPRRRACATRDPIIPCGARRGAAISRHRAKAGNRNALLRRLSNAAHSSPATPWRAVVRRPHWHGRTPSPMPRQHNSLPRFGRLRRLRRDIRQIRGLPGRGGYELG